MSKKLLKLIPTSLRVTKDIAYEVVFIDKFEDPKQVGECRFDNKQIVIKSGESPTETWATFIHEAIHAASLEHLNQYQLTENQVRGLEKATVKMLKLNKVLDKLLK